MTIQTLALMTGLHSRYTRLCLLKNRDATQNKELHALRLCLIAMELELQ